MGKYFERLCELNKKAAAYTAIMNMFDYDTQTTAPKKADEYTSSIIGIIANEYHDIFTGKEAARLIKKCVGEYEKGYLDDWEAAILKEYVRTYNRLAPVPGDEYVQFKELTAKSVNVWSSAKHNNSFEEFAPMLKDIIEWKQKFAGYRKMAGQKEYDVLLGDYEPDFNEEILDEIFGEIKKKVLPVVKKYMSGEYKKEEDAFLADDADKNKLKQLCDYLPDYLGFDKECGVISESEHPFTINIHKKDVRMTNSFSNSDFFGPVFSIIHETGHALYEQGIDDAFAMTILGEGTSMGMHETISRLYENMIGKNEFFWKPLMKKVRELYGSEMENVTDEQFMAKMNEVNAGVVRVDSDELFYPFHIIIRYELEKKLISGKMKTEDLKNEWNRLYKEYIGKEPENDAEGVLQDVHWATGEFGYFPSYVIGSAAAVQIYHHLKEALPLDTCLKEGKLSYISNYLRKNVFRYGKSLGLNDILLKMTGEQFNIKYYTDYLCEKYGE